MMNTARLGLVPATVTLARAEIGDRVEFARLLGAAVPDDWPPETLADALPLFLGWLEAAPECVGWYGWYALAAGDDGAGAMLVASGGFMGPPREGVVEIGYSVLPQFQGRGYATEIVGGLVRWAMEQPGVTRVVAETEWANPASVRVLEKAGFARCEGATAPGGARFELRKKAEPLMPASKDVSLDPATPAQAGLLANLLELYIHDLSEAFPNVEIGADGRFGYPKLPLYWSEPDRRFPFLIKHGARVAGFAFATRGSPVSEDPNTFDVAEFFVLRQHRRHGVGQQAAQLLWNHFPGKWTVRVSQGNRGAPDFWRRAVAHATNGTATEIERPGAPNPWLIFAFEIRAPSLASVGVP